MGFKKLILFFALICVAAVPAFANDDMFLAVSDIYQEKNSAPSKPASFHNSNNFVVKRTVTTSKTAPGSMRKPVPKLIAKPKSLSNSQAKAAKPVIAAQSKKIVTFQQPAAIKMKIPDSFANVKTAKNFIPPRKPSLAAPTITVAKRKPVIVIDPGHGGKDPGATGKLGTREKLITLRYSIALKRALERTGKYKVVMTRYDDRFIALGDRVKIAQRGGGDVLISIHADSMANKTTRGFSVYTLSSDRKRSEAEKLLARADKEDIIRGANIRRESRDVQEAIIDFAQSSSKEISDDFARHVARHLGKKIKPLNKHNREGSLAVLTGADIPSVLLELGYLSNEYEERMLRRDDHMNKIVTSLTNAINEYFSKFNLVF